MAMGRDQSAYSLKAREVKFTNFECVKNIRIITTILPRCPYP